MSNTRTAKPVAKKVEPLGKWAQIKAEAEERAAKRAPRPKIEPYVFDDVEPPVVISPPDDKRILIISECLGPDGSFHMSRVIPLLRALCGDEFGRVWSLIPDDSPAATDMLAGVTRTLVSHFIDALKDAMEVADLPGGTEGSSN